MDHVMWLARIFGPFFFIIGLWMFLRTDDMKKMWNAVKNTPPLMYFGAVLNLLIGLTMLSTYSGWSFGIPVLLTIIGYLMVIRGVMALFASDKCVEMTEKMMNMGKTLSYIPLVIGALITIYAFFA